MVWTRGMWLACIMMLSGMCWCLIKLDQACRDSLSLTGECNLAQ